MDRQQIARLNVLCRRIVEVGTLDAAIRAEMADLLTSVLATHRVLMPWQVVQACKRLGLPHQNPQFAEDVLDWLCKRGGSEAVSYMDAEMRAKGWVLPSNWSDRMDLYTQHGFTLRHQQTKAGTYTRATYVEV